MLYSNGQANTVKPQKWARTTSGGVAAADLVQEAGEGAGHVAFEGELAVLPGGTLRDGPLEQHAGHAVPVAGPDSVSLQSYVGGRLEGKFVSKIVSEKLIYQQNWMLDQPRRRPVLWPGDRRRSSGGRR